MQFSLTPGYEDLFSEKCNDPQKFIAEYSSEAVLIYLSFLNAQVYLNDEESPAFQEELIKKLTLFWPENQKQSFNKLIKRRLIEHRIQLNIFKSIYVTYFISRELIHYRSVGADVDSSGEYRILIAYFAYVDDYNKVFTSSISKSLIDSSDPLQFQKIHWPFLIQQFDFNEKIDPVYQTICAGLLLDHFFLDEKQNKNVESYLKFYKRNAVWQFVFDFVKLIEISFEKSKDFQVNHCAIQPSEDFISILDNFSIDIACYKLDKALHLDNLGIKKKPLLKTSKGFYLVLNWKFFYNSIYMGTAFDFIEKSKLKYNSVKSIIGYEVIEKWFFRSLFNYMFKNQNSILEFSDIEGMPDCYLRIGKYIFLIEVKDYLVSTETIVSGSFEKIRGHIDEMFVRNSNGKSKGVTQLINQITTLEDECYSFDNFIAKGFKRRNIVIVPIIITTAFTYQMPGINSYLAHQMNSNLPRNSFGKIFPLTMIDFKFFYRQFMRFRTKQIHLIDLIRHYHVKLKSAQKDLKKRPSLEINLKSNAAFEETLTTIAKLHGTPQKEKDFTKGLFDALKIVPEATTIQSQNQKVTC